MPAEIIIQLNELPLSNGEKSININVTILQFWPNSEN